MLVYAGMLSLRTLSLNLPEAHQTMLIQGSQETAFKARLLVVLGCRSHDPDVADRQPGVSWETLGEIWERFGSELEVIWQRLNRNNTVSCADKGQPADKAATPASTLAHRPAVIRHQVSPIQLHPPMRRTGRRESLRLTNQDPYRNPKALNPIALA